MSPFLSSENCILQKYQIYLKLVQKRSQAVLKNIFKNILQNLWELKRTDCTLHHIQKISIIQHMPTQSVSLMLGLGSCYLKLSI